MQEFFLESRGIAYRTNTLVPGRKTLLFVHGLSGSLSAWYPYEKLFEEQYNLVTFDLRGHGLSLRPGRRGYNLGAFVEDIRALLAHLHIEKCTVVSHSFGALIAMEFIRRYPDSADRAVFLAPPYAPRNFRLRHLFANLAAALAFAPLRLRAYGRTDYARFYPTGDWSPDRIGTDIANMGLRSYLRSLRTVFSRDYTADWSALSLPTLIVHGTKDQLVPVSDARSLAAALPHAQLIELPDANHILVLNNVEEVADAIKKFMQQ